MKIPIIDESDLLNPVEENIPIKENEKTSRQKTIKVGAVVGIIILIIVVISVTIYFYGKTKEN